MNQTQFKASNSYKPSPSPVRSGSQDAFSKPSMVAGKPVAPTGEKVGCVGILKDRRSLHNQN